MSGAVDIDALADALAERLAERSDARPGLVDAETAAAAIGVPPTWLMSEARAERAPSRRLGKYRRFSIPEVRAWADAHRKGPRGMAS